MAATLTNQVSSLLQANSDEVYSSPVGCFRSFSGCSGSKGAVEGGEVTSKILLYTAVESILMFYSHRMANQLSCVLVLYYIFSIVVFCLKSSIQSNILMIFAPNSHFSPQNIKDISYLTYVRTINFIKKI